MNERSRPQRGPGGSPLDAARIGPRGDGVAFQRVRDALAAHDRAMHEGNGRLAASCPGQGHWRGDQVPSLVVTAGHGKALVHCHTGCHTGDVLSALGLTMADLYDDPARERPRYNPLRLAIGVAGGFTAAEKFPLMWLLCKARGDDVIIPKKYQPESLGQLAAEIRPLDARNLMAAFKHWEYHGWLSMPCVLPGCFREGTHPGRGHRPCYFLDLGTDCPGASCPCRKTGSGTAFKTGSGTAFKNRVRDTAKTGSNDPETSPLPAQTPEVRSEGERAALMKTPEAVCEVCGAPVSALRFAQTFGRGVGVTCSRCEPVEARA